MLCNVSFFFIVFQGTLKRVLRRKFRVPTLETNMTTNLIIFSYQKGYSKFIIILNLINFYELDLLKSSLKLQNCIRHYISIFPFKIYKTKKKRLLYVKIILRFYPIHSPMLDYRIPNLTRLDFIIIEQYYQQYNKD